MTVDRPERANVRFRSPRNELDLRPGTISDFRRARPLSFRGTSSLVSLPSITSPRSSVAADHDPAIDEEVGAIAAKALASPVSEFLLSPSLSESTPQWTPPLTGASPSGRSKCLEESAFETGSQASPDGSKPGAQFRAQLGSRVSMSAARIKRAQRLERDPAIGILLKGLQQEMTNLKCSTSIEKLVAADAKAKALQVTDWPEYGPVKSRLRELTALQEDLAQAAESTEIDHVQAALKKAEGLGVIPEKLTDDGEPFTYILAVQQNLAVLEKVHLDLTQATNSCCIKGLMVCLARARAHRVQHWPEYNIAAARLVTLQALDKEVVTALAGSSVAILMLVLHKVEEYGASDWPHASSGQARLKTLRSIHQEFERTEAMRRDLLTMAAHLTRRMFEKRKGQLKGLTQRQYELLQSRAEQALRSAKRRASATAAGRSSLFHLGISGTSHSICSELEALKNRGSLGVSLDQNADEEEDSLPTSPHGALDAL